MQPAFSVGIVILTGLAGMAGLGAARGLCAGCPEISRKAMHVCTGLLALSFPWLFEFSWQALVTAGVGMLILFASKRFAILRYWLGGVVDGVQRETNGDLYFLFTVGLLFVLVGNNPVLYLTPLLVLTFADAAAALVGQTVGRHRPTSLALKSLSSQKTLEGSMAFAVVATMCVYAPLKYFVEMDPITAMLYAVPIALLATLTEAVSHRGQDNLTVPFCVLIALRGVIPI